MTALVLRRLLMMIPTFVGITLITFALADAIPGDPFDAAGLSAEAVSASASAAAHADGAAAAAYRHAAGLDDPLLVRYGRWVARVARLDFGVSTYNHRPVLEKLREALPNTFALAFFTFLISYGGALLLGTACAVRPGGAVDRGLSAALFFLYSVPGYWVAVLLLLALAGGRCLTLFPLQGLHSPDAQSLSALGRFADLLWHLALPVTCLSYASLAAVSRYVRGSMIEVLGQDYIRTARANGVPPGRLVFVHGLRNGALPLITLMGLSLPHQLGGFLIIEQIFGIPGMSRLGVQAIFTRDYPTLLAVITVLALATMGALLLSDLAYAFTDPRIRLAGERR